MKLNAVDVLYLHYINNKTVEDIFKYDFWFTQYAVHEKDLFQKLITLEVIYKDTSLPVTLSKLTVKHLQHLLQKSGIKISGNKSTLISRIVDHSEHIDWGSINLKDVYLVTSDYNKLFEDTTFINYFHFNGQISIFEAYDYYLAHPNLSPDEVIIAVLNRSIQNEMNQTNKYSAIKGHLLLSNVYQDKFDNLELSFYHLDNFSMLIILESIAHQSQNSAPDNHSYIDNFTIDKYRTLMRESFIDHHTLYKNFIRSALSLPYSYEQKEQAAKIMLSHITK